jgi:hypothetical protein
MFWGKRTTDGHPRQKRTLTRSAIASRKLILVFDDRRHRQIKQLSIACLGGCFAARNIRDAVARVFLIGDEFQPLAAYPKLEVSYHINVKANAPATVSAR